MEPEKVKPHVSEEVKKDTEIIMQIPFIEKLFFSLTSSLHENIYKYPLLIGSNTFLYNNVGPNFSHDNLCWVAQTETH
jgi:hypothetical protein